MEATVTITILSENYVPSDQAERIAFLERFGVMPRHHSVVVTAPLELWGRAHGFSVNSDGTIWRHDGSPRMGEPTFAGTVERFALRHLEDTGKLPDRLPMEVLGTYVVEWEGWREGKRIEADAEVREVIGKRLCSSPALDLCSQAVRDEYHAARRELERRDAERMERDKQKLLEEEKRRQRRVADWVAKHGDERLQLAMGSGYPVTGILTDQILSKVGRDAGLILEKVPLTAATEEVINPSLDALRAEDKLAEFDEIDEVCIVSVLEEDSYESSTRREAIRLLLTLTGKVVYVYLGRTA
jgi:hypothetical protein